jgi:hypothetical protein
MRFYQVERLKPGMKTAAHLLANNQLLLVAGTRLTRETIERLPIWGIFQVPIEPEEIASARDFLNLNFGV